MILFIFLIVAIALATYGIIRDIYIQRKERVNWICGSNYSPEEVIWLTAKMKSDYESNEFLVRFNPVDGFFYDKHEFGYLPIEIKILRNGY